MAKRRKRRYGESFDRAHDLLETDVGVVLTGPRGGGKSWRWARMLDRIDESNDRRVVHRIVGSATSRSIPLGAFAPLLPQSMPSDPTQAQLLALLANALVAGCSGGVILGIDDVDLLDDTSATLVTQLVRSGDATLVATRRSDESAAWLESLGRLGLIRFEALDPLDDAQIDELAGKVLEGPLGRRLAREVRELSCGNPARVRVLLEGARDRAEIVEKHGVWLLAEPLDALSVDHALTSSLQSALDSLDDPSCRLAETLAVVGTAPYDMIEAIGAPEAVESLERAGLVEVDRDRLRAIAALSDPLVAAHLRSNAPFSRRRQIAHEVGEWFRRVGGRRVGDALTVAQASLSIGAPIPLDVATRATAEALRRGDPWSAEAICQSALDRHDLDVTQHGALRLLLARAQLAQARPDDALAALDDALAALDDAVDGELRVELAIERSRVQAIGFARLDDARELLAEARRHAASQQGRARLDLAAAHVELVAGRPRRALHTVQSMASETVAALTVDEWATYRLVDATAHVRIGRHRRGLELVETTLERLNGDPGVSSTTFEELRMLQVEALIAAGELGRAGALASAGVPRTTWAPWRLLRSELQLLTGDVTAALETCRQSGSRLVEVDDRRLRSRLVAHDAVLRAYGGDTAGAAEQLGALRVASEESDLHVRASALRASILIGDTLEERAPDLVVELIDHALDAGEQLLAARVLHDGLRLDLAGQVEPAVDRLRADEPTGLAGMLVAQARAVLDGDATALEHVAWELHDAGALLLAADSLRHAADLYRSNGDDQRERRVVARIETLLRMCPGAQTGEAARRSRLLTARQHQVAALARSHSNLEIAEQLNISVRTVENHLQAVFSTLGLHSRAELSSVFGAPDHAR